MMFSDLQDKINALYGYTPSQSNLLQNPELLDMAIMAIAANATDLSAIATAYNNLMGTALTSGDLIAQPDKTMRGVLAIASSTTSLSILATSYNTLMGTAYTASTILSRPDLVRVAMMAAWAAITDLAALTAKVNALMGWTPTTAQLLGDLQLLEIALSAVIGGVSTLSAIATSYNEVMGTSLSASDLLANPEKIVRGAFFLIDSSSLHPDTLDWISRVELAGGAVSVPRQAAVDVAINAIYTAGLRGSTNYLRYLLCLGATDGFTGSNVPIWSDGVGNAIFNNLVSGDFSNTAPLGLLGNGSNKYINTAWNPVTQLGAFSTGDCDVHIAAWVTSITLSGINGLLGGAITGSQDAVELYTFGDDAYGDIFSTGLAFGPADGSGFLLANRTASNSARILKNGSLLGSSSSEVNPANPNYPLFAMALNNLGVVDYFSSARFFAVTFGPGLSVGQESDLYDILAALKTALEAA